MIIEYEWVNREPFLEYNSHKVQNWLIQFCAEAYRSIRDWDKELKLEISGELCGPRVIPNWDRYSLQVSGELDL